jgi:hypothetical protein
MGEHGMNAAWAAGGLAGQPLMGLLRGTHIATEGGETTVETLLPGMRVRTPGGEARPIAWIGRRRITPHRHPHPDWVRPVRIRRGAIANNLPRRDLALSAAVTLSLEGVAVPVRALINGATIALDRGAEVAEYFHLQLDGPDLLRAEGVMVESHRAEDNQVVFGNAGPAMLLHPGAPPPLEDAADAAVQHLRRRLLGRAQALGHSVTCNRELIVRTTDGTYIPCTAGGADWRFVLPLRASDLDLVSRAGVPAELEAESSDQRRLGVLIERIVLRGSRRAWTVALDDPALSVGFHRPEFIDGGLRRWTDGHARLPAALLDDAIALEVHVAGFQPTWAGTAPPLAPAVRGA